MIYPSSPRRRLGHCIAASVSLIGRHFWGITSCKREVESSQQPAPNLTRNTHPQATVLIPEPTGDDLAIATLPQPEPARRHWPASGVCHPGPTVQQRYKQLLQRSDIVEYMAEYGLRYERAPGQDHLATKCPCPCPRPCLSSPGTILLPPSLPVGPCGIGSAATIVVHVLLYCRYHTQGRVQSSCSHVPE